MNLSIREFDGKAKTIIPLAEAYMESYNQLSEQYKSKEEMACYIKGTFIKKLKKYANDGSSVFVLYNGENPRGFLRYSNIQESYKHPQNGQSVDYEHSTMDGYEYAWNRKVNFFNNDVQLTDRTMIVNQIYLAPEMQNHGIGTQMMLKTLPLMQDKYDDFIIEYNANNNHAKKFYANVLGLTPIASSKDFDHIVKAQSGSTCLCISDVEIGHSTIQRALNLIGNLKQRSNSNTITQAAKVSMLAEKAR